MAGHNEPTFIVTPATRDVQLPGEGTIVTPAIRDVEIPENKPTAGDKSISFEGQVYNFPADTTDEEMFEFLNQIPTEEQEPEEPPEPLREQAVIKKDEGVKRNKDGQHIAYRDTEKILTGGRGHVLTKEEKKLYPKGTSIPDEVVNDWFKADMLQADEDITALLEEKAVHVPDEVFDILLNMSFNLGKKGLKGFKKMWAAIEVNDWNTASAEMEDSKWFKQTKNRAVRLVARMKALGTTETEQLPAE